VNADDVRPLGIGRALVPVGRPPARCLHLEFGLRPDRHPVLAGGIGGWGGLQTVAQACCVMGGRPLMLVISVPDKRGSRISS
jgi:hypothetical protein